MPEDVSERAAELDRLPPRLDRGRVVAGHVRLLRVRVQKREPVLGGDRVCAA